MWWFRKFFAVGFCLFVSACGYKPIYGPSGAAQGLDGKVSIDAPSNRAGYILYHQLENRLKDTEDGKYKLSFSISETSSRAAIDADGRAHRAVLEGFATYNLRRLSDNQTVTSGRVKGFTGYSTLAASVASHAASRDATQRLMTSLAEKIVFELVLVANKGDI